MARKRGTSPSSVDGEVPGYGELEPVGRGGVATVYRARQERFDRTVALKVLAVDLVDEKARRRFRRECMLAGRLSEHPNVVTVYDAGTTRAGRPFIAMEYCQAGSLADRLRQQGPLPLDEVLRTGVKLAGALAAAHEAGIVHRDVKPQNVLLSRFGEPALADFGVAAFANNPDASVVTDALTPVHAAPEVLEGDPATAASDLYSLGSTLYALLAGGAPYARQAGEGIVPLLLRILEGEAPRISRDDVPDRVTAFLRQAMSKEPGQRFRGGDAAAFGQRLQQLQAGLGLPVTDLVRAAPAMAGPPSPGAGLVSPTDTTPRQRSGSRTVERRARPAGGVAPAPPPVPELAPVPPRPGRAGLPGQAVPVAAGDLEDATQLRRGRRAAPAAAPAREKRRNRLLAPVILLMVIVVAAGAGLALRLQLRDRHRTKTPVAAPATVGTAAATPSSTIAPAVIDAARPTGLTAVASGSSAVLHWHNPQGSRYPLFLSQAAPGQHATLQPLGNGLTTTTISGLDPARPYCFRVVAALSFGTKPVLAASAPACTHPTPSSTAA
jgi:serine/threonine-protein kinase PknK